MKDPIEAIHDDVVHAQELREREQQVLDWLCDNPQSMRYIVWRLLDLGYLSVYEVAEMREQGHRIEIDNIIKQFSDKNPK